MASNVENDIIDHLKTKNGTSTLAQIIQHLRLPKRKINQTLYKLKTKGKVVKVHKQNPPVWKLNTQFHKLNAIESSDKTGTKCEKVQNLLNDSSEKKTLAESLSRLNMPRQGWPGMGRAKSSTRGRGKRRGRGRGRGRDQIQLRKGNWTDGSEKSNQNFTPSATSDKTYEILRFLEFKGSPVSLEEITHNLGSYATLSGIENSLSILLNEKKVIKMSDDKYALNVVKSVVNEAGKKSMMNDDPAVLDFKMDDGNDGSSLGFNPQMEIDEMHEDGQFSNEDDYDDEDDDEDDLLMEMKSTEGWGVYKYYDPESNPEDVETGYGGKDEKQEESQLSGEDINVTCPESLKGIKQELAEDQECQKETTMDSIKLEGGGNFNEISQEDCTFEPPDSILSSSGPNAPEHNFEDKVLLALTEMPFQTGAMFILKGKIQCESSDLERVLNKLRTEKLVGLTYNVWTLTESGETYLKRKGLWTKAEISRGRGRGQMMKQKEAGPPQSPLKLVTSDTVFSTGVEKSPVPLSSYQPDKEKSIQIFPTPSDMSSIPSLMNMKTTNPSVSLGRGRGLLATSSAPASQKISVDEGKPFTKPPTPAELARMENERLSGKTDPISANSSVMPNCIFATNLYATPSHTSGQTSSSSVMFNHSSPAFIQSHSSSQMEPGSHSLFSSPESTSHRVGLQGLPSILSTTVSTPHRVGLQGFPSVMSTNQSSPVVPAQPSSLASSACSSLLSSNLNDNLKISTESFSAVNKNPISALMEYAQSRHQQAKIEVVNQRGPSHKPTFIIAAIIGTRIFPGVKSRSKKDGRTEAADLALRILLSEGQYKVNQEPSNSSNASASSTSMTHFDKIAALSHQAFNQLIASIPEKFAGRKVIAALVLKRSKTDTGTVISVGSGNRCITGEQLSLEGNTVNDSHAEIITRRGFIRFLYKQLETYTINQPHEFFEEGSPGKLRIKSNFTFHLYISTAPCGDGALFSPRDAASNRGPVEDVENHHHNPTFTSNVQGVLRTKMEGGEGTIPIESDFTVQTWDGIVRGERLRTMSCTDKICRWNVVGMQGALLSHLLEPVYLNSLTLGYLYDHGHLARAVCCRVGKGEPDINNLLPSGYQLNHPWLGRMTACEPQRETQKTKALSINWCLGDERPEVIDGTTGRCYTGVERTFFSRLCKKELYTSFRSVCTKLSRSDLLSAKTYLDAKKMATDFQSAKNVMLKRLKDNGFSIWVSKPMEEEMFSC